MVGGLLSEATGGDFKTGALAAGASELVSKQLAELAHHNKDLGASASQIVGVLAASAQSDANSQSLNSAAWVAKNATLYNRQLHADEDKWLRENAKTFASSQGITDASCPGTARATIAQGRRLHLAVAALGRQ
jgi:filamentous hemagglutinin